MGFNPMVTVMAADKIDLSESWDSFFAAIEKQAGPILSLLAVIGVLLVVAALVKWAWDRRRGGGMGQGGAVWGSLLVGSLLAAPKVIIPMFLLVFDVIANAVIDVFYSTDGVKKNG